MSLDELIIRLQQIQAQHADTDKMAVTFDNCYKVSNVSVMPVAEGEYKVDIF